MANEDEPEWWEINRMTDYVRREGVTSVAGPKTSAAPEGEPLDEGTAEQIRGQIRRNNRVRGFARENDIEDWDEAQREFSRLVDELEDPDSDRQDWKIRRDFSP